MVELSNLALSCSLRSGKAFILMFSSSALDGTHHRQEDYLIRRFLSLLLLISLLLAACGSGSGSTSTLGTGASPSEGATTAPASSSTSGSMGASTPMGSATSTASPPAMSTLEPTGTPAKSPQTLTMPASGPPSSTQKPSGFPVTYTGADGVKVAIKRRPERIVSLFPVNNDTLFSIGADDQIVAVDDFTYWPKAAAEKPKIGGGSNFDFNVEKITAFKPDLVITNLGTSKVLDKPLRNAGIKVVVTPTPNSLQQTYGLMQTLGRLTGHLSAAKQQVARLQHTVSTIRARAAHVRKVSVYYETDASTPGKPYTNGANTLPDELIKLAGGKNVFGGSKQQYLQVSYESIVAKNPQVIVLTDAKGYTGPNFLSPVTVSQVKQRTGFNTISAVKNNRVVPLYSDHLGPGPRLNQGIRDLAVALHPEIFGEK